MFADLMVSGKKQRFVLIIYVIQRFRYFVFIYPDRLRGRETQQELLELNHPRFGSPLISLTHSLTHSSSHTILTLSPTHQSIQDV
jgi:hypothetical protein